MHECKHSFSAGVPFAQEGFFVNCSISRGVSSNFDISKTEKRVRSRKNKIMV